MTNKKLNIINYNPKLKKYARELRKNSTLGEILLWNKLRVRQIRGYKFLRQKPIGDYIADFFCPALNLIIEIDGAMTHDYKINYDNIRKNNLENLGFNIIKFRERDVRNNLEGVAQEIIIWIEKHTPRPPSRGELKKTDSHC